MPATLSEGLFIVLVYILALSSLSPSLSLSVSALVRRQEGQQLAAEGIKSCPNDDGRVALGWKI